MHFFVLRSEAQMCFLFWLFVCLPAISCTLEAEWYRRKLGLPSRVVFLEKSAMDQDFQSTGTLELRGQNKKACYKTKLRLQVNKVLKLWWNRSSDRSFQHSGMDADERELTGVRFKQIKWLEKSCIQLPEKSLSFLPEDWVMTFWLNIMMSKNKKLNICMD